MRKPDRETFREEFIGRDCLLKEIGQVGWTMFPQAKVEGLGAHEHGHAFEICYVVQGNVEWWAEREVHDVKRGDLYLTWPHERHGGVDAVMHPCEIYWLQVAFPKEAALAGLTQAETRALAAEFAQLTSRCFPGSDELRDHYELILAEHRRPTAQSRLLVRAALHQLLVRVLRDHAVHREANPQSSLGRSPRIQRALIWMEDRVLDKIAVSDVAAAVGVSPSRFHEQFLHEVGHSPAEYLLRRRIFLSRCLLQERTQSITEIAHSLGFSSSQYFATAFKRLTGMTPGDYREKISRAEAASG